MPVGDVLRVVPSMFKTAQLGLNVLHYRISAVTPPESSHQQIANELETAFAPLYKAVISSQASWLGLTVQRENPLPRTVLVGSTGLSGAGNLAGDPLPTQVAGILTFRTGFAGRAFRGRAYLPFPTESVNDSQNQPTTGYIIAAQALGAALIQPRTFINGAGQTTIVFVVFHRGNRTSTDVTTGIARGRWATQRRRGDFGTPNIGIIG